MLRHLERFPIHGRLGRLWTIFREVSKEGFLSIMKVTKIQSGAVYSYILF